jgi:hypothetical protein
MCGQAEMPEPRQAVAESYCIVSGSGDVGTSLQILLMTVARNTAADLSILEASASFTLRSFYVESRLFYGKNSSSIHTGALQCIIREECITTKQ